MKRKVITLIAVAAITAGLTSCRKDKSESSQIEEQVQQQTNAGDDERVMATTDEVSDDANKIIAQHPRLRGFNYLGIFNGQVSPCNTTVDTSLVSHGQVTVTFNGLSCDGKRDRSGSMTIQLPYDSITGTVTPWSDAGSQLTVTFNNLTVTHVSSGKTYTLNGVRTITNVNGGLVDNSPTFTTPILHHITGMLQITFDNNTTRTWNIDRDRLIERTNNVTTITSSGNASEGGFSNVAMWGINRLGNMFYVTIDTPIVRSSTCDNDAMSGVKIHHGVVRDLTVTFGVDQQGNAQTSGCPYGYKLNWVDAHGNQRQCIVAY
ncbi:MAG: hypothetical protein JSS90_02705 [Bacteroidetes bacterium]|jgi:hypothetical protein|nr:hypothetical protein [Bacteroidota bacterium]